MNHEDCNNNGDGKIGAPFCHIQHALDYLQSSIDIGLYFFLIVFISLQI